MKLLLSITIATYYLSAVAALIGLGFAWWKSRKEQPKRP